MMSFEGTGKGPSAQRAVVAFLAMVSVYFFSYFQRAAIPGTIFNELQADMGLSAAAVASLGSMFTWVYGGMQIFVGMLTDRYGGVRTLLGGGLLMASGALLFPLSHSTLLLFIARILTGFGASFIYLSILKELDFLFGKRNFTVAVGAMLCVAYCGGMAGSLPFERATAAFGWRNSLLVVAVLMFATLAIAGMVLRRLEQYPKSTRAFSFRPLGEVFHNRACWPLLASSLFSFPIFFVIQTVLGKKFLQDFGGLSSPTSATFILVMTAVSAISVVVGGFLPRILSERRKPCQLGGAIVVVLAAGLLLVGVRIRAPGWLYLGGFVLLAVANASIPAGTAVMKELNRSGSMAAAISVMNGLAYLGCGTIGQAGGFILDLYSGQAVASCQSIVYPQTAYMALFGFLTCLA
ncbi:MAG: MFS transporter, partial [Lentisphaerota bacterium]